MIKCIHSTFIKGKMYKRLFLALTGFEAKLTLSSDKDKGTRSQSKEKKPNTCTRIRMEMICNNYVSSNRKAKSVSPLSDGITALLKMVINRSQMINELLATEVGGGGRNQARYIPSTTFFLFPFLVAIHIFVRKDLSSQIIYYKV